MTIDDFTVGVATEKHLTYVDEILKTIEDATKVRGTGIAKRNPEYVKGTIYMLATKMGWYFKFC